MNKKTFVTISIALFLASTAVSTLVFVKFGTKSVTANNQGSKFPTGPVDGLQINESEPKTEMCPLNGAYYTKTEADVWAKRRPLAIMVENSPDARPHSGIVRSDLVYETVAEGGVTRFMALYLCDAVRNNVVVAPVRSVRTYFIDWASEYGERPLLAHVGGANCSAEKLPNGSNGPCKTNDKAQAIEQLVKYQWRYVTGNDLDQFALGAKAYIRNESRTGQPVATEHSVEGRTENLWKVGAEREFTNTDPQGKEWTTSFRPWKFKDDNTSTDRGTTTSISYDFWEGYKQFDARWDYDVTTNSYKRSTGGEPHVDLETKQQLTAKNVVVQFTKETGPVDELKHMLYQTIGDGNALVFQDGKVIEAKWSKKDRLARTIFTDKKGKEIEFSRGRIWISILDTANQVTY